jgi:hypothetical protein
MYSVNKNRVKFNTAIETLNRQKLLRAADDYYLEQLVVDYAGTNWTVDISLLAYLRTSTYRRP